MARITDLAVIASNRPVRMSSATTPTQRLSSTRSLVTNASSCRVICGYLSEVWKTVCSMWKPDLSAAKQVRHVVMPPKGRTAMVPSGLRLHGHPQCSIWMISTGASRTKASTTSWSAR